MDTEIYAQLYELEERHWWFRGRRAVIQALIEQANVAPGVRSLDAGCGTGGNLVEFAGLGEIVGVDASEQAVEFCHKRGLTNVQRSLLESLPFEANSFGLILACDVLEHIRDETSALEELRRVATPNARMVVTVPAYQWLWSRHDEQHHHFRRYTRKSLADSMARGGWRPLRATYFNTILLGPIALARFLTARRRPKKRDSNDCNLTPGWANGILGLLLRLEASLISRGMRLPMGVSLGVVCEVRH